MADIKQTMPQVVPETSYNREEPINPFATLKPKDKKTKALNILKTILFPIQVIKLLLIILDMTICSLFLKLVLLGKKKDQQVHGIRKFFFNFIARMGARVYLFLMGYYWITVKGKRDTSIPLIISNHCSGCDAIVLMSLLAPSFVAKQEVKSLPFYGTLATALNTVFVARAGQMKQEEKGEGADRPAAPRNSGTTAIMERLQGWNHGEQPIVIFAEGTTVNQRSLIPFRSGAFRAGVPCQPVLIRLPFKHSDPSDASRDSILTGAILCKEFVNHLSIEWLAPYHPSEQEKADPRLYANNVRAVMAEALGVPMLPYTYVDKLVYQGKRPYEEASDEWKATFGEEECLKPFQPKPKPKQE
eukprot:gnl/Dysnectes_brevis/993_a1106_1638.p1 GENE.gnl/Dysnectes_brevis/993_a1106_1638~~gnl/Dysnectes_brevis/993_a1106_1638.p1  ORF type:complete len:358 (+),score=108.88 gnl/Dysnectes_brevis/993_a1106_1638:824-1897(+)